MASPRGVLLKISPNGPRRSPKKCALQAVSHFPRFPPYTKNLRTAGGDVRVKRTLVRPLRVVVAADA
jgi:hypothetical protein